jgi:hypothetical protein
MRAPQRKIFRRLAPGVQLAQELRRPSCRCRRSESPKKDYKPRAVSVKFPFEVRSCWARREDNLHSLPGDFTGYLLQRGSKPQRLPSVGGDVLNLLPKYLLGREGGRGRDTKTREITTSCFRDNDAVSSPVRAISSPGLTGPCRTTNTSISDSGAASPRACEPKSTIRTSRSPYSASKPWRKSFRIAVNFLFMCCPDFRGGLQPRIVPRLDRSDVREFPYVRRCGRTRTLLYHIRAG